MFSYSVHCSGTEQIKRTTKSLWVNSLPQWPLQALPLLASSCRSTYIVPFLRRHATFHSKHFHCHHPTALPSAIKGWLFRQVSFLFNFLPCVNQSFPLSQWSSPQRWAGLRHLHVLLQTPPHSQTRRLLSWNNTCSWLGRKLVVRGLNVYFNNFTPNPVEYDSLSSEFTCSFLS